MSTESARPSEASHDRRAVRTRDAVHAAAIALVTERGTSDVALAEIASAAGVSRQTIYLHYRDRDDALIAAAVDLFATHLVPTAEHADEDLAVNALATHFDAYRAFYRAMMDGPCGTQLNRRVFELIQPFNRQVVRGLLGNDIPDRVIGDISVVLTGGVEKFVTDWVVSVDPDAPEVFASRLMVAIQTMTHATERTETR